MASMAIIFDNPNPENPNPVFFPGQTITGRVQIICQNPTEIQGIKLNFLGFSRVHWMGTQSTVTISHTSGRTETIDKTKYYKHFKEYYKSDILLNGDSSTVVELPPGNHLYDFSYVLPEQIPSSFKSDIAQVSHQCKGLLTTSNNESIDCHKPYSVNTLYDLNLDPIAKAPINADTFKTPCGLFFTSGPVTLVLKINRSGYVPGEKLIINAECFNKSKRLVRCSKVKIIQVITYTGLTFKGHARQQGYKQRKQTNIVAKMKHGQIPSGESDTWINEGLLIPHVPPSHPKICQFIDIDYFLEFSVVSSGPTSDLKVFAPLVIGSVPLQQNISAPSPSSSCKPEQVQESRFESCGDEVPSCSSDELPSAPPAVGFTSPGPGLKQYPDIPPPPYTETMSSASLKRF